MTPSAGRRRVVGVVLVVIAMGALAPTGATGQDAPAEARSPRTESMRSKVADAHAGRCAGSPCTFPTAGQLGLVVSVDGRKATNTLLDESLKNAWTSLELGRLATEGVDGAAISPADPAVVVRAAAWTVFNRLLEAEAVAKGLVPSDAEVRAHALRELENITRMGLLDRVVPAGQAPEAHFLSPGMLAGYRVILGSGRVDQLVTAGAANTADAEARRVAWVRSTYAAHDVHVEGLPAGASVAMLPDGLYR